MPKNVKGGTFWDLLTNIQLQNIFKKSTGEPFETLCTKFALAGLGLSGFRSFSRKWTDQCESEEKKGHCKSWAFLLKRKKRAPTKKQEWTSEKKSDRQTILTDDNVPEILAKKRSRRRKLAVGDC